MNDSVRDPAGQALVCDQAAARLAPAGFDPSPVPEWQRPFVERGIPLEEADAGAAEWVARRLTPKQREAVTFLGKSGDWATAAEIGVASGTLYSLWDFRRSERDCCAPLGVVTREYAEHERCYHWYMTKFGRQVYALAQRMSAGTAETASQAQGLPASAIPTGDAPNLHHDSGKDK